MSLVIAIPVTLCAALAFATSSVLEQRSTKQVQPRGPLSPRLLLDLMKRPLWLAAIVLNAVGSVLQIVALRFGELATVQPLLVCNLLFAVLIASFAVWHRRPDGIILLGVVACAAGLACFLAVARPSGGTDTVSFTAVLPLGAALAALLAVCLAIAIHGPPSVRPLVLAFATGVDFGVTAFLLKLVSHALSQGAVAQAGCGRCWAWRSPGRSASCSARMRSRPGP